MGNFITCCGVDENKKEGVLEFANDSKHNPTPEKSDQDNSSNIIPTISPSPPLSDFQYEERQRALLREQERLERIVNDAGQDMVPVNGVGMRGVGDSAYGYYDGADIKGFWKHLIPSRNNGGLTQRCEDIDIEKLKTFPNSDDGITRTNVDIADILSQSMLEGVWDKDAVKRLDELIGAGTATTRVTVGNDGMRMLLDDLAMRFLGSVFKQDGFQAAGLRPIVENIL